MSSQVAKHPARRIGPGPLLDLYFISLIGRTTCTGYWLLMSPDPGSRAYLIGFTTFWSRTTNAERDLDENFIVSDLRFCFRTLVFLLGYIAAGGPLRVVAVAPA